MKYPGFTLQNCRQTNKNNSKKEKKTQPDIGMEFGKWMHRKFHEAITNYQS